MTDNTPTITRFAGIELPGWNGPLPGGGMTGATAELDALVGAAAAWLAATFDRDVQVRFNSDRQSGGAWVEVPSNDPFCQVGITAYLPRHGAADPDRRTGPSGEPPVVQLYAKASQLIDPAEAGEPNGRYEPSLIEPMCSLGEATEAVLTRTRIGHALTNR